MSLFPWASWAGLRQRIYNLNLTTSSRPQVWVAAPIYLSLLLLQFKSKFPTSVIQQLQGRKPFSFFCTPGSFSSGAWRGTNRFLSAATGRASSRLGQIDSPCWGKCQSRSHKLLRISHFGSSTCPRRLFRHLMSLCCGYRKAALVVENPSSNVTVCGNLPPKQDHKALMFWVPNNN